MATEDRLGLRLSTSSLAASAHYREGVDLLLAFWPGADAALEKAIEADDCFAVAMAARARVSLMQSNPRMARQLIRRAHDAAAVNGTARERSHVAVLRQDIEGTPPQTLKMALAHIDQWPRDALILSLLLGGMGLLASSGTLDHDQARVDLCEGHRADYGDDWWLESHRGFSHIEAGNVAHGRRLTERSLELRRENANAAHALTHALFESGAGAEADAFVDEWLPTYGQCGLLHGHISWHQALAALDKGDVERAIKLYAQRIKPSAAPSRTPRLSLADCASFLWRLDLYGFSTTDAQWAETYALVESAFPVPGAAFVDAHVALAAAATRNLTMLSARADVVEQRIGAANYPAGEVVPKICRGLVAFASGDYRECATFLEAASGNFARIGGSHAQREVFEDTLIVALLRCNDGVKAKTILHEQLHRRPSPRDEKWLMQASGMN